VITWLSAVRNRGRSICPGHFRPGNGRPRHPARHRQPSANPYGPDSELDECRSTRAAWVVGDDGRRGDGHVGGEEVLRAARPRPVPHEPPRRGTRPPPALYRCPARLTVLTPRVPRPPRSRPSRSGRARPSRPAGAWGAGRPRPGAARCRRPAAAGRTGWRRGAGSPTPGERGGGGRAAPPGASRSPSGRRTGACGRATGPPPAAAGTPVARGGGAGEGAAAVSSPVRMAGPSGAAWSSRNRTGRHPRAGPDHGARPRPRGEPVRCRARGSGARWRRSAGRSPAPPRPAAW
jgi:hypothetical protein